MSRSIALLVPDLNGYMGSCILAFLSLFLAGTRLAFTLKSVYISPAK